MNFEKIMPAMSVWIWALILAGCAFVFMEFIKRWVSKRLKRAAGQYDLLGLRLTADILDSIYPIMTLAYSAYIGARLVELSPKAERFIDKALILAFLVQLAFWGLKLIDFGVRVFVQRREQMLGHSDHSVTSLIPFAKFLSKVLLFILVALLALDNLGFNISALLAGLGVGGIAVALALQNILGDVFSSLSIILDKPFEVGDTITVGNTTGKVEKIGLKTTRLRSVAGQQIIFSNTNLLNAEINNFKRMTERRHVFTIGVTYETSLQKLSQVSMILKDAVCSQGQDRIRFDRAHFKGFGPSSLDFEVSYMNLSPELNELMGVQEKINLEIVRRFEDHGLAFAYPTQTLYLQNCDKAVQVAPK